MKIFAREGNTLFATLTHDEFNRLDSYREAFAVRPEHRRSGVGPGTEVDLVAWFEAADRVTGARAGVENLRAAIAHEVERLREFAETDLYPEEITVADFAAFVRSIERHRGILARLRCVFEDDLRKIDEQLAAIGPPELKT